MIVLKHFIIEKNKNQKMKKNKKKMRDAKKLNHAFLNYQKDHQEYKQKYR
jgi:hypothetical protein